MAELKPIDMGSMEFCPTSMSERLKELIPSIEKALNDADGDNPYATFKFEDVKQALGSKTSTPYGFSACLNILISEHLKEKTNIVAHALGGNIMFNRTKGVKRVVTD